MRARVGHLRFLCSSSFQYRQAQWLVAKSAAVVDLTSSSMTRTSWMTIRRRALGSCAQIHRCTLTPGPLLSLCTAVGRLASPSIATFLSVHVRLHFTLGYISKTCRISHRHQKDYETGYLTSPCNLLNKCCPVIRNICRVCHWPIMEKLCFASAG